MGDWEFPAGGDEVGWPDFALEALVAFLTSGPSQPRANEARRRALRAEGEANRYRREFERLVAAVVENGTEAWVLGGLDRVDRDLAEGVLDEAAKRTAALEPDRRPARERAIEVLRARVRGEKPPARGSGLARATADGTVFVADPI